MVGMVDDGTLILELYPLAEIIPSGDDQKEKVLEIDDGDVITKGGQKEDIDDGDVNTRASQTPEVVGGNVVTEEDKVDEETAQTGDGNQEESCGEVPEQSEPTIIYLDQELASVALRVSPRDFLQLIGVDDPKQDRGEVTKVYDDRFVQLHMIDGVSVCVY